MKNVELVVKHNSLINATNKYKYEKNELKLICVLISSIHNQNDKGFGRKYINISDLNFSNSEITNRKYIIELCHSIMSKPFMVDGGIYNWFTKLKPLPGVIEYEFHEDLKSFLLELKENFTKYHLNNILKLRSSYSIQVFELLLQYKSIKHRNISIEDFRKLLNIPNSYTNKDVRVLIENIQLDLKENTSIQFDFNFEKLGRSFSAINFYIQSNKKIENISFEK